MANAARAFEPVDDEAPPGRGAGPWPQGASRAPSFSIGRVVESLRAEFPAVTLSKVRFLEDQGLVRPARTGAGYRKYSEADVERIRFVLTEQRDSFTPLRVIGEKLAALDAGHDPGPSRKAQVVASEGRVVSTQGRRFIPASDLCDLTGVDVDTVTRYARLGLITPDLAGYFPSRCVQVVALLARIESLGVDARVLRTVRTGADRNADNIDQAVSSTRARGRSADKERASARSLELGEAVADLHRELLRVSLSQLAE